MIERIGEPYYPRILYENTASSRLQIKMSLNYKNIELLFPGCTVPLLLSSYLSIQCIHC